MAALTFPASRRRDLFEGMKELNRVLGRPEGAALHAVDHLKDHAKMRVAMRHLVGLDFVRVFFVVVPKTTVPPGSGIGKDPELLYNFTARLLLERASWFARGRQLRAQVTFGAVKRLPASVLHDYVAGLQADTLCKIDWDWLMSRVKVEQAQSVIGLQWADVAGRAIHHAIHPNKFGDIEPAYLLSLAPVIWEKPKLHSYGLKCLDPHFLKGQPWWGELEATMFG